MIELKFTAENWPDMIRQLRDVLGANPVTSEPPLGSLGSVPVEDYKAWVEGKPADKIAAARKKPGRKIDQAIARDIQDIQKALDEASPEVLEDAYKQIAENDQEAIYGDSPVVTETADGEGLEIVYEVDESAGASPKELLELKDKVIDLLQAEYRAGKVQKVRDFLVKYGKGVKSFRQIDINDFAAMDKAIQNGALT